ncbi:hypothetical protein G6F49_010947 [Rhizopus delemar]|nr:hypothetical protein G6F49_010947 [Rhizopus delemar]
MPPTRGPYNKVQPPSLSEEQLAELNSLFTKYRKNLTCPACKATTTFHRHGSSTRDPTQPQFMCTSCRKYIKAHSMYQLVQFAATFDDQSSQQPDDMDLPPTTLEEPQSVVQQLQKTVEFLTAELAMAYLAIQNLQNQLQTITPHSSQRPTHTVAARFFQPPSPSQGFKYLYIPNKSRIPVGTLRTMFRRIGVNNARLLDIHYPTRNTAAILIHNDFETGFTELLKKHGITLNENFDPNNGSILEDPKLKSLSDSERDELAKQHQITRLERAVQHIRTPIKFAVARFFYEKQWISKKFYNSLASDRYPQASNIFTQITAPLEINPNSANLDNSSKIITDDDFDMSDDQGTSNHQPPT